MFTPDFFPTPQHVIQAMLQDIDLQNKTVLEPSAGKGNIVDYVIENGAEVIACEKNSDLVKILSTKCKVIAEDFFTVKSENVSHIDLIIMNPPFSADEKHIDHAFDIAPPGCKIIALCNLNTLTNRYSSYRQKLQSKIDLYGHYVNLGNCFTDAERTTGVEVAMITLVKPGASYDTEFEGFFIENDPEEAQFNGLMPYNLIRDVVNRYIQAVKIYDEQLDAAVRMNNLTKGFYSSKLAFNCTEEGKPKQRNEFKKDLQKSAWNFIFGKMNMEKYTTQGLKEDINKFVEKQEQIPFTMRNVYRMLEVIVGTQSQRMDKALLEVFDRLTKHYHENRYSVEGWKTNSYYLINPKFILPYITERSFSGGMGITHYDRNTGMVNDMVKALCFLTGENYDNYRTLWEFIHIPIEGTEKSSQTKYIKYDWNTWYDWGFFEVKGFKKGTMHFKFKDMEVWGRFNQKVAQLLNYPLFEAGQRKAA